MPKTKVPVPHEIIASETPLVPDQWLYHWSGDPPRDFCLGKTLFRLQSPADIVSHGWQVLIPAVAELVESLDIRSVAAPLDWLKLDAAPLRRCLIGVYADRTVVAADAHGTQRKPFIPYRYYEMIQESPHWQERSYSCSYRHFVARFHTGLTFCTSRHGLLCDVAYSVHFGVRGVHSLWSTIRLGDTTVTVPSRVRVSDSLDDLPGKVERLTRLGQSFIARLGAAWLPIRDRESLGEFVTTVLQSIRVPAYKRNELRRDGQLVRCATMLDLLLFLAKALQSGPTATSPADMMKLSQTLLTTKMT